MASLGTMVSSVAHEINNPISFISFNIPILRDYVNELLPLVDAMPASIQILKYAICRTTIFAKTAVNYWIILSMDLIASPISFRI